MKAFSARNNRFLYNTTKIRSNVRGSTVDNTKIRGKAQKTIACGDGVLMKVEFGSSFSSALYLPGQKLLPKAPDKANKAELLGVKAIW